MVKFFSQSCEESIFFAINVDKFRGDAMFTRLTETPREEKQRNNSELILESQKANKPRHEAPRRNVIVNKHIEDATNRGGNTIGNY